MYRNYSPEAFIWGSVHPTEETILLLDTVDLSKETAVLQIVALKIILGADCPRKPDGHFDYPKALTLCNLQSLFERRETRTLTFGKKSICHPSLKRLFPLNEASLEDQPNLRHHEPFHVNFARTATRTRLFLPYRGAWTNTSASSHIHYYSVQPI